jgi:hypothetical protein
MNFMFRQPLRGFQAVDLPRYCLGSNAETLPPVPCPGRSTRLSDAAFSTRSPGQGSPWPQAFSPRTPPVVGHAFRRIEHLCSSASSILCPCPTSRSRACRHCGLCPLRPDRPRDTADRFRDLPASVQGVCVHALVLRLRGSGTPIAISRRTVRPSHIRNWVGNPRATDFGAQ